MDTSRWQQIKDIYRQALDIAEPERRAFVTAAAVDELGRIVDVIEIGPL